MQLSAVADLDRLSDAADSPSSVFNDRERARANGTLRPVIRETLNAARKHGAQTEIAFAVLSAEDESTYPLLPEEAQQLSPRACPKKHAERTLGRVAARLALAQLGFGGSVPVLSGDYGEPLWPDGIAGSITHCWPWSVAAVAKSPGKRLIGIDLESVARARSVDISEVICRKRELDWIRSGSDFYGALAMLFSAKEAVYKAFHPLCKRYIDFQEVELAWSSARACFEGEFHPPAESDLLELHSFEVHCRRQGDLIFSLCDLSRELNSGSSQVLGRAHFLTIDSEESGLSPEKNT